MNVITVHRVIVLRRIKIPWRWNLPRTPFDMCIVYLISFEYELAARRRCYCCNKTGIRVKDITPPSCFRYADCFLRAKTVRDFVVATCASGTSGLARISGSLVGPSRLHTRLVVPGGERDGRETTEHRQGRGC